MKEHNYDNCHNLTCRRRCEEDGYNNAIDDAIKVVNSILIFETIGNRYIDIDLLYVKLKQLRR